MTEEQRSLNHRFLMRVSFPEQDETEVWDSINTFQSPLEALRGCSECLETVKMLLGNDRADEAEGSYVKFQVWDAEQSVLVLWEDDNGSLCWEERFLSEINGEVALSQ